MPESHSGDLRGRRLLVVEDDYMIAADLACQLEDLGAEVVGPACSVQDALELVASEGEHLDGAALDINLNGQRVFPVADALMAKNVPFIFATGYDKKMIPEKYSHITRCDKPVDSAAMARVFASQLQQPRRPNPPGGEGRV